LGLKYLESSQGLSYGKVLDTGTVFFKLVFQGLFFWSCWKKSYSLVVLQLVVYWLLLSVYVLASCYKIKLRVGILLFT